MSQKIIKPMRPLAITKELESKLLFPALVSFKLNGFRALTSQDGKFQSKSGEPFPSRALPSLFPNLPIGVDGELIYGNPTVKDALAKTKAAVGAYQFPATLTPTDLTYWLFDSHLVFGDAWARYQALKELYEHLPIESKANIRLLEKVKVSNLSQLKAFNEHALSLGYEGIVGSYIGSMYRFGESKLSDQSSWKMKPVVDEEFLVTGFEEQYQNNNPELRTPTGKLKRSTNSANLIPKDTLGALIVYSQRWGTCRIGTGFTDELRDYIWNNKHLVLGVNVTAEYYPTVSMDKPHALTFKAFRPDFDMLKPHR